MASKKKNKLKSKPSKKVQKKAKKVPTKTAKKSVAVKSKVGSSQIHFQPLFDRVLVQRDQPLKKTAGGIFIPDSATDTPNRGVVISVGPGRLGKKGKIYPVEVKPGQHVLFGKYSGSDIKLGGKEFVLLKESEIIGIVEK